LGYACSQHVLPFSCTVPQVLSAVIEQQLQLIFLWNCRSRSASGVTC
jgi:hypothetical protein